MTVVTPFTVRLALFICRHAGPMFRRRSAIEILKYLAAGNMKLWPHGLVRPLRFTLLRNMSLRRKKCRKSWRNM